MSNETRIAQKRTMARHDRGVLVVHVIILLLANIGMYGVTAWLLMRQQVFSVPDVTSYRELEIKWGRND